MVRDGTGARLWGAMGPVYGLFEQLNIIWGAHAGVINALKMGFDKAHIEIDNREAYDTIRF